MLFYIFIIGVALALVIMAFHFKRTTPITSVCNLQTMDSNKLEREVRKAFWVWCSLFAVVLVYVIGSEASAGLSEDVKHVFNNEVKNYVNSIMNDAANPVARWSKLLTGFLFFCVVFSELTFYIFKGFEGERIVSAFLYVVATLIFIGGYNYGVTAVWEAGDGIALGLQQKLVNNSDNFFIAKWITKSVMAVNLEDVSIFDGFQVARYSMLWFIAGFLLDLVAWIASIWSEFGYALAKILGLIFVPFLMTESTRSLFDAWFKFLLGFVLLNVMLKATLVLAVITIKATLVSLGVRFTSSYGDPIGVNIASSGFSILADGIAMLFVASLFVLSSFAFAGLLASGSGSLSGAMGKVVKTATRKLKPI